MDMGFSNFHIELNDHFILVKVLSNLDCNIADETRKGFEYIIDHLDRNVRLDLSLSNDIDASGIGAIVFLFKRLKSLAFNLELTGVNEKTLSLLQSLHIDKIILIN